MRHALSAFLAIGLPVLGLPVPNLLLPAKAQQFAEGRIVFDSNRDGQDGIFVMDAEGANVTRIVLTPVGRMSGFPDWSPDGKKIAFASNRDGPTEIYVVNLDGTDLQRLTRSMPGVESISPDWSPDGGRIAFVVQSLPGELQEIHVMNADGSQRHSVTAGELRASFPAWSPDGQRIAFSSRQTRALYVMNADGSEARPITHRPLEGAANAVPNAPAWSPDGKRIIFDGRWGGDWDIWTIDADGANQRQLTQVGADTARAAWSPDGKRIAFHSTRDRPTGKQPADYEIYVMDADGSNVRRLTSNSAFDAHPDWR
jgi:TolB protein